MRYSNLLMAIMTGKWMILPQSIVVQEPIVAKLLNRDYDGDWKQLLSEKQKIEAAINGASTRIVAESSQFDGIPKNSTAIFSVTGTMLKYGTMCSYGTMEIAESLREAVSHPHVASLILSMDSGGGSVDAIAPLVEVIKLAQSLGKPVIAHCDLCASACYYVACHCDEIIASNDISAEFGSIGVMMGWRSTKEKDLADGIVNHVVYSTRSKWKNLPFRKAEEGGEGAYELLQSEELDPLEIKFENDVIAQRGKKLDRTVEGILEGRMFFSDTAKANGLIDGIGNMEYAIKRAKELKDNNIINSYLNK